MQAFLRANGLLDDPAAAAAEPLTGGVASDIVRVAAGGRVFVVKRALSRLRVAQDWRVPTVRNAHEVAWLELAGAVVPGATPRILAHDPAAGMFAMEFLDPAIHPVWKAELRAGRADPGFAGSVGRTLAAIHAATARDPAVAARFANQAMFRAIRVDPYLGAAALAHPDRGPVLRDLGESLLGARVALVHGDVSPKNILAGPRGPVLLDAECACYGDPAFDLAFCLNHLLLKCAWMPAATQALLACFDALAAAYLGGVAWEPAGDVAQRTALLLPALLLARIDGKSPVEYLTDARAKARVRAFGRQRLIQPAPDLATLRADWAADQARVT